jgi:hypothetical protein
MLDAEIYLIVRQLELDRPSVRRRQEAQSLIDASRRRRSLRYWVGPRVAAAGVRLERLGRRIAPLPQA